MIEFTPWPKIARLNRDITITEKIDGTNAAVGVVEHDPGEVTAGSETGFFIDETGEKVYQVYAQSRKQLITPQQDNHGFACWVEENKEALATTLGPGLHFGEWWGSGIQRGYGLPKGEKWFSLFNTKRWAAAIPNVPGLSVVPVLYQGPFDNNSVYKHLHAVYPEELFAAPWSDVLASLAMNGSRAVPGFMRPEGIVIYHHAANMMFKVTLENDEEPKAVAMRRAA